MLNKLKVLCQILLLQLTAKAQSVSFEQLPFTNPLQTDTDSVLHEQVKSFFKKAKTPGLLIGISKNGETSFYSYGFRDSVSKQPFTSKTIFEAGSVTKTFTANLLFQLAADKVIDLEKPVTAYLPDSVNRNTVLSAITFRDLASHKSGLSRIPSGYEKVPGFTFMQPYRYYKKPQLYSYLANLKKINPGKYDYSNLGFGLLSTVFENASGKNFETLLAEYIWQPIGMKNSYVNITTAHPDTATGYFYGKPAGYWEFDCLAGCGAVKTNAEDLLKYLDAHINNTQKKFTAVVSNMLHPAGYVTPEIQICSGWHTFENMKRRVYWHNGGTYGFSSFAGFEPVTKTSLVLAANATAVNAQLDKLAADLLIWLTGKE